MDDLNNEETKVDGGIEICNAVEDNTARTLENSLKPPLLITKRTKFLSIASIFIIFLVVISYNMIISYQENEAYNSCVYQLRNAGMDSAYSSLVDVSNKYSNRKAGSMAKQYLAKFENYKQLTDEVKSLTNEVSSKEYFMNNDFITISNYLEQANTAMSMALKTPIRDISNDAIWSNQSQKFYQYIKTLPQNAKQNFSEKEYSMLVSASSLYSLVYVDASILMNEAYKARPDEAIVAFNMKNFEDSVDLFNNDNYPFVKSTLNKISSDFNDKKSNLAKKQQDLATVKHDLDNAPLL